MSIWYISQIDIVVFLLFCPISPNFAGILPNKQERMKKILYDINDFLTWHPEVLAYTGLTILVATVAYSWIILLTL